MYLILLASGLQVFAQDYSIPALSPRQKVEQQFSISKITVDYGRPSVKNRKIFGDLVPFNTVWRMGANQATTIKFGQDVDFGGQKVKAGTYAMYALPSEKFWKIMLNKGINNWGAYAYDAKDDVCSIVVPALANAKTEVFTISFDEISDNKIELSVKWDLLKVAVNISSQNPEETQQIVEQLRAIKKIEGDLKKKSETRN